MTGGPRRPFDDPAVLAAVFATGAVGIGALLYNLADPARRRDLFREMKERKDEKLAEEAVRDREKSERMRFQEFEQSDAGKALYRKEAFFVEAVREPFPDAVVHRSGSAFGNRYDVDSPVAHASFHATFHLLDNRGHWKAHFGEVSKKGEFSEREWNSHFSAFVVCDDPDKPFSESERDTLLRLLGGDGGPNEVTFARNVDQHQLWKELRQKHDRK